MEKSETVIIDGVDIENYLKKQGRRGEKTISLLAKIHPFIMDLMEHEIVKRNMAWDISMHEEFLLKEYENKITPEEKGEYEYLKKRIVSIAKVWQEYIHLQEQVKKGGENATIR